MNKSRTKNVVNKKRLFVTLEALRSVLLDLMLDYCTAESPEFFKYEVYMLKFQIVRIFLQDTKAPADN